MSWTLDLVERTWEELGYRVRATGWKTWVRTMPHPRKIGSIWLPPKLQSFHGELPHLVTVHAVVLSSGPLGLAADFKPGDRIAFKRLHFGYWQKLEAANKDEWGGDEQYVGWVDANQVLGFWEDEDVRIAPENTESTYASL